MSEDEKVVEFLATVDTLIDQWADYLKAQEQRIERLEYAYDNLVSQLQGFMQVYKEDHPRKPPS